MFGLKNFIASHLLRMNWHINVKSLNKFILVEITDPSFLWANVDDLFGSVIEFAFRDFNYLSVSQFVDRDQWLIGERESFIRYVSDEFSLPVTLTRSYDSNEDVEASDSIFVINLIGYPKKTWITKVVRFGMVNNPNILYGLRSVPENWISRIIELNSSFRKWFEMKGDISNIDKIVQQVDVMGWTEDGHLFIAFKDVMVKDEFLATISKLAREKSLYPIIKNITD